MADVCTIWCVWSFKYTLNLKFRFSSLAVCLCLAALENAFTGGVERAALAIKCTRRGNKPENWLNSNF